MLLTAFSLTVNAEELKVKTYSIEQTTFIKTSSSSVCNGYLIFTPNDDVLDYFEYRLYDPSFSTYYNLKNDSTYVTEYIFSYNDSSPILDSGKNYELKFTNLYYSAYIDSVSVPYYIDSPDSLTVYGIDSTGAYHYIEKYSMWQNLAKTGFDVLFDFAPTKDISKIVIVAESSISNTLPNASNNFTIGITSYLGEFDGDDRFQFKLEYETEEEQYAKESVGLLDSIKNGISNLFSSILELPQKIWSYISQGFENLITKIIELPDRLWTTFQDGIYVLFVPDEGFFDDYKEDWDILLNEHLGCVYEVANMGVELFGNIVTPDDPYPYVSLPEVTIPLPDDESFTFGGYEVLVVPEGFEFLAEAVQTIVGIVCVTLFVNGLYKRYEEFMGVEK